MMTMSAIFAHCPDEDDNNNANGDGRNDANGATLWALRRQRSNSPSLSPARAMNSSPAPSAGGNNLIVHL
jgi:hypothetical protein